MMRYFNTSGPCYPDEHYTVMREALLAQGKQMVERGRYFTIFAPRQAGKTTFFHLLIEQLKAENIYTPIWVSFENLKTAAKEEFYQDISVQLTEELSEYALENPATIRNPIELSAFFKEIQSCIGDIVLFIDEFEGIPASVLNEVMHTFRKIYHRKKYSSLHAIGLVGVSTVAELVVSSASPFNIVDELGINYFTLDEVQELIQQYVAESGQEFEAPVVRAIYENTQGQPGLVCAICQYLVDRIATDRTIPVAMEHFYPTLRHFLTERFDKNILNIVQKAREKREFMLRLLFSDTSVEFTVDNPDIAYLYAHGVVDHVDGLVAMPVPLYSKRLITAFRPTINGEAEEYFSLHESVSDYVTPDGLNVQAILTRYRQYVRRRGFRAFDTEHLKEGAWHYSLDGFINFFIQQLGGDTFIETPTGRGRTDILIIYGGQRWIIETKIFTTTYYFNKGKTQLAEYATSEGLNEGYYVVFSNKHTDNDVLEFEDEVKGKRIYTLIVCTHFDRATDQPASTTKE